MSNTATIEAIKHELLALDPDARVQLAHAIAVSLTGLPRPQLNDLWLAEAVRRDAQMESGEVESIAGDEVFARIESRYIK